MVQARGGEQMTIDKPFRVYDLHILASPTGVHYGIPIQGGLENMQDTIENLAEAFENHPGQGIHDYLVSLNGSDIKRNARVLRRVAEALKTASLRED